MLLLSLFIRQAVLRIKGGREKMKFDGNCVAGCGKHHGCLVGVELYLGQYPASNLTGRMCPQCGTVYVIDLYGNVVISKIPSLRMKIPLFRKGILTGKIAFWEFNARRFQMPEESGEGFPKGLLGIKLPYYRNGILSGGVLEAGISLDKRTIGGVRPSREV